MNLLTWFTPDHMQVDEKTNIPQYEMGLKEANLMNFLTGLTT